MGEYIPVTNIALHIHITNRFWEQNTPEILVFKRDHRCKKQIFISGCLPPNPNICLYIAIFTSENIILNVVSKASMKIFSFLIVRKVEIINIRRKVQLTNYPLE